MRNAKCENVLEELKTEAAEQSPRFSEDLHRKIMQRIGDAPSIALNGSRRDWPLPRVIFPSAIAAAAALAVVLGGIHLLHRPGSDTDGPPKIARLTQMPSVPKIHNPVDVLEQPAQWTTARYGNIDQDGEKLIGYMTRQLDVLPRLQTR